MHDYIRAFLQVVAYYEFLKGGIGRVGPSKEELKLRWAQCRTERTGDPTVLQRAFLDMPGAEDFYTREPHLEGVEVFGSQKQKPDTPIGADNETHRPDTIIFSCLRLGKRVTRSGAATLPTVIDEVSPSVQEVLSLVAVGLDFCRVTAIQESKVNENLWHIARVPLTCAKCCWAQQAITKKKCTAQIVVNGRSTPAPTYTGVWRNVRLNREQPMQFFICTNDIERCVKGLRWKWFVLFSNNKDRPPIPLTWPVKVGTKLSHQEIDMLKNADFQLPQKEHITPTRLFNISAPPIDLSGVPVPLNLDSYPSVKKSKTVRRSTNQPLSKQMQVVGSAIAMQASILRVTMIPQPGFGCIVTLQSKPSPRNSTYQLTLSSLPDCTYPAFKETMSKFGRRGVPFKHCKHLYFILVNVCSLDLHVDLFIHAPTFSFNEIKKKS